MKGKLFLGIQKMLNEPGIIDVGIDFVYFGCHPRPDPCAGPCIGWEICWEHLSAPQISEALKAHEVKLDVAADDRLVSACSTRAEIEHRSMNTWYGIVPELLQSLADVTKKKVYATRYSFSGWKEYYDQAETYEFIPGGDSPKCHISR